MRCFWGLDKSLAYSRHFPAIHWLSSYSEYLQDLSHWYQDNISPKFVDYRNRLMALLNQESSLLEIVKLIGSDVLPDDQKLILEIARVIRLGFLQQNAFIDEDAYSSYLKQFRLLDMVLQYDAVCREAIGSGADMNKLFNIPARERIGRAKMVPQDEVVKTYNGIIDEMKAEVAEIAEGGEDE